MLLKLWPIIGFQLHKFLHKCSISGIVIGSIHRSCNGGVAAFSHIAPYNSPSFQEGNIPLEFNLNYFFFFLVNSTSSCVSRMILAVCTLNLFQAVFLCMVRVLFTAFGTRLRPLQASLWCPNCWHLQHTREVGRTAKLSQDNSRSSPLLEFGAY